MSIKLAIASDTWQVMKTRPQTEHECGIRMVMYMVNFRAWAMKRTHSNEIGGKIGRLMMEETRPKDLAVKYRRELDNTLKEEQRRIGG